MRTYNHLKFLFLAFTCSLFVLQGNAQTANLYGNEWINYSQTYYKLKVGNTGIFRVSKGALDLAGLPGSTPASELSLWHNGQEVAIYTSTAGILGSGDFIEFYGKTPDGKYDTELYSSPAKQTSDKICLFTDTSAYFLTYSSGTHLRYAQQANTIPATPPAIEPFVWATSGKYYGLKNRATLGSTIINSIFFSSQFGDGEGFINNLYFNFNTPTVSVPTPKLETNANVDATITSNVIFTSTETQFHSFDVAVGTNTIATNIPAGKNDVIHFTQNVPSSMMGTANTGIKFSQPGNTSTSWDWYGQSFVEIRYPRNLIMTNTSYLEFQLDASSAAQYLEFSNMLNSGNTPRLYDLTNNAFYTGDVQVNGKIRFLLSPSLLPREFVLYSDNNTTNLATIIPVKTFQFTNYTNGNNEGNYVIVSHKDLEASSGGANYLQEYKDYRQSTNGGSFTVQVADVSELYDQFAWGLESHPLAIKHFLKYGYNTWTNKPEYAYMIGRGVLYNQNKDYLADRAKYYFPNVPTYGDPGSDVDLVNFTYVNIQDIKIGRLSVWNGDEIGIYLNKVKAFEAARKPAAFPTPATENWKKIGLHIAGGSDVGLQNGTLLPQLLQAKSLIEDTLSGKYITTVAKNTSSTIQTITSAMIDSMINSGVSQITYYGHGFSGGFEYNLNDPETYTSAPRLPVFTALGCDISQCFALATNKTVTERYILAPNAGSIAMVAGTNTGYTNWLSPYLQTIYKEYSYNSYGKDIGTQTQQAFNKTQAATVPNNQDFSLAQAECMLLSGDPATGMAQPLLPDYYISDASLATFPTNVNSKSGSFQLRVVSRNLAEAIGDTVLVSVEHINPQGVTTTVTLHPIAKLTNTDTFYATVPVDEFGDIGLNKYRVTIDPSNAIPEISEANNTATLEIFIFSDDLVPVYPREFGIVNTSSVTLKASTLNVFHPVANYLFQIDTSELFTSPLAATTINSVGGILKWQPNIPLKDSTVYYWRTTIDSSQGNSRHWTSSSFIYLANGAPGWNQSHYFQWKKDAFDANLRLDADRKFRFAKTQNTAYLNNTIWRSTASQANMRIFVNDVLLQSAQTVTSAGSIQFMIIDSISGQVLRNDSAAAVAAGADEPQLNQSKGHWVKEFRTGTATGRINAANYLRDSIPAGQYVFIKNVFFDGPGGHSAQNFVDTFKIGGPVGGTLYDAIYDLGFTAIDSYTYARPFIFGMRKGYPATIQQRMGSNTDSISLSYDFDSYPTRGQMNSTIIGPAKEWTSLKWRTKTLDNQAANDTAFVKVYGIDAGNNETPLFTTTNRDTSIAGISATQYPSLRMEWISTDSTTRSSTQQDYWRVLFTPAPEAALNPAAFFTWTDSVQVGQKMHLGIGIENLTETPMDSLLVRYKVIDAANISNPLASIRYRALPGLDTIHAELTFDPAPFPGSNQLFIEANPDNDQPEQYHPNNLGYIRFGIATDRTNPLLDVTFDGVHILDRDIVSAKPFIKVLLKDENKYLALDDTSLVTMSLRYPGANGQTQVIPFDGSICKFVPSSSTVGKNEASIEFKPNQLDDGIYKLSVAGRDKSGNKAGGVGGATYDVEFEVVNKTTVSNVLNYPNPFSTSTAFVFTLTGSQLPTQFKIQILSVTGKVVKEITRQELGILHIGRNITEYKWDGKDQYGQTLGNGVYMYRVVTAFSGEQAEHRDSKADDYFKNGWGKMYIMR